MDAVEKIARACLYEGYLLWPYRRGALKNARRWTFGGVYPQRCGELIGEPSRMRTEVLLRGSPTAKLTVHVRFLQVIDRQVYRNGPTGPVPVDELRVEGHSHLTWQEATERRPSQVTVVVACWTTMSFWKLTLWLFAVSSGVKVTFNCCVPAFNTVPEGGL